MDCPTSLKDIRKRLLTGLEKLRAARDRLAGALSIHDEGERRVALAVAALEWNSESHEAWDLLLNPMPDRVRRELPEIYDPKRRGSGIFAPVRGVRLPDGRVDQEFTTHPHHNLAAWIDAHPESQVVVPDIAVRIDEATRALDGFEREGLIDLTPTLAELESVILDEIAECEISFVEKAEREPAGSVKRYIAGILSTKRPLRGLAVDAVESRIREREPAADAILIEAALDRLERGGKIKKTTVPDFEDGERKKSDRLVWVLLHQGKAERAILAGQETNSGDPLCELAWRVEEILVDGSRRELYRQVVKRRLDEPDAPPAAGLLHVTEPGVREPDSTGTTNADVATPEMCLALAAIHDYFCTAMPKLLPEGDSTRLITIRRDAGLLASRRFDGQWERVIGRTIHTLEAHLRIVTETLAATLVGRLGASEATHDSVNKSASRGAPRTARRGNREIPKEIELKGRAAKLHEIIRREMDEKQGRTLEDMLDDAGVLQKVFRTSPHFADARLDYESLKTSRLEGRVATPVADQHTQARKSPVACPSCEELHSFLCPACHHDDLRCPGCHTEKSHSQTE